MENPRYAGSPPQGFQPLPNPPTALGAESTAPWLVSFSFFDKQEWFHPNPSTSFNFAYAAEKPWASREEPQANSKLIPHSSGHDSINIHRGGGRVFLEAEWSRGWASNYADLLATYTAVVIQGLDLPEMSLKPRWNASPTKLITFPISLRDVRCTHIGELPLVAKIMHPMVILHCHLEVIKRQKGWSPTVAPLQPVWKLRTLKCTQK